MDNSNNWNTNWWLILQNRQQQQSIVEDKPEGHAAQALACLSSKAVDHLYNALDSDQVDVGVTRWWDDRPSGASTNRQTSLQRVSLGSHRSRRSDSDGGGPSLGANQLPTCPAALILALRDADGEVRKAAVSSLGKIGGQSAREPLQAALNDPLEVVRVLAKLAIAQIERQSTAES